eukprot:759825-Hanusia_phi.AAC.4
MSFDRCSKISFTSRLSPPALAPTLAASALPSSSVSYHPSHLPSALRHPAGGVTFDNTYVSESWLGDSDNGANAMDMTGSDQGAYNNYVAVDTFWADTTNMDNIRGADITDHTVAGSTETISGNVTHTNSSSPTP